ncbi:MAG: glutamine--tRNA ligase/YqeY domain fusion protein [Rhodothermales bacterium]
MSVPVSNSGDDKAPATNFIRGIINEDLRTGKNGDRVVTRFPPEPNGYLHIGHASSICLNFGIARDYPGAVCHLRFDDTNPETEEIEYVESIQNDVHWLGFDWKDKLFFASDYFEQLYGFAVMLIEAGKAYVDSLTEEEMRARRGTVNEPGTNSPHRDRSVAENLDLFARMRAGAFPDGAHTLRAKIDMASPNMLLRDPVLYRIKHAHHYRTGDAWCIYPLYDFAHPLSDAIEGVTHSICTLEFEVHRPLYDWLVENVPIAWDPRPRQHEFARRNLNYTVTSKRKLLRLVNEGYVDGWDDPRMPTIAGLRRRGYTAESIQAFCDRIGISRATGEDDIALLEYSIRDDLNHKAPRVMAVLDPLKVVITNFPEGKVEEHEASYWPHDVPKEGSRMVPFSRELFIEREDFMENPPRKFHRLSPGSEVRLRYAYIIRCTDVVKDAAGNILEVHCTYDPDTKSGGSGENRKVKGTIHWVSAAQAVPAEVRLYDRLFSRPDPEGDEGKTFLDNLNPTSRVVLTGALVEPGLAGAKPADRFQFERQGYFVVDPDTSAGRLVFNRIVTLRDTWAKISEKETPAAEGKAAEKKAPAEVVAARTRADVTQNLNAEATTALHRYIDELGLDLSEAEALVADSDLAGLFEATLALGHAPKAVAAWVVHVLPGALAGKSWSDAAPAAGAIGELIDLIEDGTLSTRIAKDVFGDMVATGKRAGEIVETRGLRQVSDSGALAPIVTSLMDRFPDKVAQYKDGKTGLIGFFVGEVMKETKGQANPQVVKDLLAEHLG